MATHRLKTWTPYYDDVVEGRKTFELRKNDRGYEVGDELVLIRWDPDQGVATGEEATFVVTFITDGQAFDALQSGWVCMGIKSVKDPILRMKAAIAENQLGIRGGPKDLQMNDETGEKHNYEVTLWGDEGRAWQGQHGWGRDPFEALEDGLKRLKVSPNSETT
jgi:hypothetical protein